jgi:Mg2+ and Co2+ transporter CorA
MRISRYALAEGKLQEQPVPADSPTADLSQPGESWYDVCEVEPEGLRQFLAPLALHPLVLDRCLAPANDPSVLCIDRAVLLEFPTASDRADLNPAYLTILLQTPVLVTIRHSPMPALDGLVHELQVDKATAVYHLPQLVYLILDHLADLNVDVGMDVRDQIARLAQTMTEKPDTVSAGDLARLRWQVDKLVALIENQLFCVTGLNASDNEALRDPHRKAYIQDLVSEAEIAQKSVYRLEGRMNDLFAYYQMAGNDRVEKRLRILTIVSVTTLPLALITGLLGMNVGGLPGTNHPYGFLIVIGLMAAIAAVELWYFIRKGWFD